MRHTRQGAGSWGRCVWVPKCECVWVLTFVCVCVRARACTCANITGAEVQAQQRHHVDGDRAASCNANQQGASSTEDHRAAQCRATHQARRF